MTILHMNLVKSVLTKYSKVFNTVCKKTAHLKPHFILSQLLFTVACLSKRVSQQILSCNFNNPEVFDLSF